MRSVGRLLMSACLGSTILCVFGCGDDDSTVPFDQIPRNKKLVELTPEERQGVCEWAAALGRRELPPPGTQLNCDGIVITLNAPRCVPIPAACQATVGQWEVCLPQFVDRVAEDPCLILDLGLSPTRLEEFVNAIPGCEGLGVCATTTS